MRHRSTRWPSYSCASPTETTTAAQFDALPYEAVEAQEEFQHRTLRQHGQHHEEDDSEGRFDQHDDAILGQSDQERTEHELALEESDRSAYDLTPTGEPMRAAAAWLANIPADFHRQPLPAPHRHLRRRVSRPGTARPRHRQRHRRA
ncbi:MAG: hypothetical protein M9927_23900 [Anaerolineae bacterium]|nr:hypothetical protein [Anaerolineae bacterium]